MFQAPHVLKTIVICGALSGCGGGPDTSLPPVPPVDTTTMRGAARTQIEQAYAEAAAHPGDIARVAELALVLHAYGHVQAADIAYRRALALRPGDARLKYLYAFALQARGDVDAAIDQYGAMTDDGEFGARGWARIADLRLEAGDWPAAQAAADSGLRRAPQDPELRYLRGRALLEQGNAADALQALEAVLAANARLPEVYYAAGRAALAVGDEQAAAAHFEQFERVRNLEQSWPDKLVRALADKRLTARTVVERTRRNVMAGGDVKAAVRQLESALQLDPEAYEAHIALVGLYGSMRKFPLADLHYDRAMKLAPNTAQLHFNLATVRMAQSRYDEAAAALARTIELAPSHALAHALLGRIRYRQRAVAEARALLDDAVRLAPSDPTVRDICLPIWLAEKDYARSLELLDTPAATPELEARRQLWRAQVLRRSGNSQGAHAALDEVRALLGERTDGPLWRQLDQEADALAGLVNPNG